MDPRGIIIKVRDGFVITLSAPYTLASQLSDGCEERLLRPFNALRTSAKEDGFAFCLAGDSGERVRQLTYKPDHYSAFLCDQGVLGCDALSLDSEAAADLLLAFGEWLNSKQAEEFERDILAGDMTFEEARAISPKAFNMPRLQKLLVERFKTDSMPKGRPGKRTKYRREVEELYGLACRIYRETPGISWEEACDESTSKRPELVPATWIKDPGGSLEKQACRYWDKSNYSQKTYRDSRDG
ncbi:hypothetical protein SAMN05216206_3459 [Pseudomonas guineae]|uniref:Uncharacterized protein n=1 Tax=Pseudomonas guineae TaxID=425504 RepID=A0A1I3NFI4_9PSED|nr:hypothetical protein [Pseudomonas guineae]SFJ07912.1 hypothetical protein SAMN05216206_3459 [Pseudomonas guineae]